MVWDFGAGRGIKKRKAKKFSTLKDKKVKAMQRKDTIHGHKG